MREVHTIQVLYTQWGMGYIAKPIYRREYYERDAFMLPYLNTTYRLYLCKRTELDIEVRMFVHYNRGLPCVPRTATLKSGPGLLSSRAVRRCILSFSASSSRVCIQPWSRVMRRRDFRWRTIAPIIPGDV